MLVFDGDDHLDAGLKIRPGSVRRSPAVETRHDGVSRLYAGEPRFSKRFGKTGRARWLDGDDGRGHTCRQRCCLIPGSGVVLHSGVGQGAHANGTKDMRRLLLAARSKLLVDFSEDGLVAVDDQLRDVRVPLPSGVLDEQALLALRGVVSGSKGSSLPDTFIVVLLQRITSTSGPLR